MDILIFLDEVSAKISECEKNAKKFISDGNNDAYINTMYLKAEILAELPIDIKKYDENTLSPSALKFISENINSFSTSAKTAIKLQSTWYMSQLLFNEDYKEGDPNNFELFVQKVKKMS
jgi:hypothetical protein